MRIIQHLQGSRTRFLSLFQLFLGCTLLSGSILQGTYLFESAALFETGRYMEGLATADFNEDGAPDLAISKYDEDEIAILLGAGDGTFASGDAFPAGNGPSMLASADFDRDGHADLAVANYPDQTITILLGDGEGEFGEAFCVPAGTAPEKLLAADFNNDDRPDLVIADNSLSEILLFPGNGDGTFAGPLSTAVGEAPQELVAADFNGDGDRDLAVPVAGDEALAILLGRGDGTFDAPVDYPAGEWPCQVAAGDFNEDGSPDLAVLGFDDGLVYVFPGNGDGTFAAGDSHSVGGSYSHDLALADLDNDGHLDLVLSNSGYSSSGLRILLGDGAGHFAAGQSCFAGSIPGELVCQDVNGDGLSDGILLAGGNRSASILLGRHQALPSAARSFSVSGFMQTEAVTIDVNGDGLDDIAVGDVMGLVGILISDGGGAFHWGDSVGVVDEADAVASGDLNGDLAADLVVAQSAIRTVTVHLANGDGTFQSAVPYATVEEPTDVILGDLDGEEHDDLVVAGADGDVIYIFLNDGSGTLIDQGELPIPFPGELALGNLNGDENLDLVVASRSGAGGAGGVLVLMGNGDGSFAAPAAYAPGTLTRAVTLGDLNGDGCLDLAAAASLVNRVYTLLNDGSGGFGNPATLQVGDQPEDLVLDDLDLNGRGDLAVVFGDLERIKVYPGVGDGTFAAPWLFPAAGAYPSLVRGDFDADGLPDLAATGLSNLLLVLLNSASLDLLACGPGPAYGNPPMVRTFSPAAPGTPLRQWQAYGADHYGVNVSLGNLDDDVLPEVVTGPGPGSMFGPHVRGFDADGTPLPGLSFLAYGTHQYGVRVACGALDADGFDEIVTGPGPGAVFGPHVRGWNWDGSGSASPIPGISFFAYGTPRWGVNVACGDIDGDGFDEIVTGAGPGAVYGPHVRGWNWDGQGATTAIPGVSFLAYGTHQYGVNVACGDIDGDGIDEIVSGAGPGAVFGPHVRAWNWDGSGSAAAIPAVSFLAYDYRNWGVNVACGDLDEDGADELLTGPGPGPTHPPRVRGWNYDGQVLTLIAGLDFLAFDASTTHGVMVAGDR